MSFSLQLCNFGEVNGQWHEIYETGIEVALEATGQ